MWTFVLITALIAPQALLAHNWKAIVGAQNSDKAHQALAFLPNEIWIHSGPFPPSSNVTVDSDGARHAIITSPSDNVHSGFIEATLVDDPGLLPQNPLDFTRFRVTFKQPGTYKYRCVLHDNLGMVGIIKVTP